MKRISEYQYSNAINGFKLDECHYTKLPDCRCEELELELVYAEKALEEIEIMGRKHPQWGDECSKVAKTARLQRKERNRKDPNHGRPPAKLFKKKEEVCECFNYQKSAFVNACKNCGKKIKEER